MMSLGNGFSGILPSCGRKSISIAKFELKNHAKMIKRLNVLIYAISKPTADDEYLIGGVKMWLKEIECSVATAIVF